MKKLIYTLAILAFAVSLNAQWESDVRLTNNPSQSWGSFNNAWTIAANGLNVHAVWYDERDGGANVYYKRSTLSGLSWGADLRLSSSNPGQYHPSVAVSGNVVHIIWRDGRHSGSIGNSEIYYKRSTDNGVTWEADTRLTNDTAKSYDPSLAVSGSVVHVVWYDERNGVSEIYYKRSTNAGVNWSADTRLTNNPAFSEEASVAVSGSNVCVVWQDDRDNNFEIYCKRSTDAGTTWGADTRLSNNTNISKTSCVAISGSVVNVVWYDFRDGNDEIYCKRSTDGGVNWGADTRLTNSTAASQFPSVAVSGTGVHIVWVDARDGNPEIYYNRSTDGGVSWGTDTRLTNNTAWSRYPSVKVSGTVVNVVWYDQRDGNAEIYYKRSTDAGVNWEADMRLTNNTSPSYYPSVSVSGSVVHVVWEDNRDGNYEIYYKRSTDAGVSWGADARLTSNTGDSWYPSIAVSGSIVHVVWSDYRNGNYEIYYKRSTDSGVNWEADTRLTNFTRESNYPSVTISGSVVHVVWSDDRDINFEIYYKRDITGNPTGIINVNSEIPSSYSLGQNYPNPFNPITNIKFSILNSEQVKLFVYDAMGREVQTLVNESLKPGTYEATFDGSQLTSGVYFYKLMTDGFVETRKMILIK